MIFEVEGVAFNATQIQAVKDNPGGVIQGNGQIQTCKCLVYLNGTVIVLAKTDYPTFIEKWEIALGYWKPDSYE